MRLIIYDKWLTLDGCPKGEGMKVAVTPNKKIFCDQHTQTSKKKYDFWFHIEDQIIRQADVHILITKGVCVGGVSNCKQAIYFKTKVLLKFPIRKRKNDF